MNNKYDFVMLFDVTNGNPNGDPDNANAPRIDVETNYGLVSDVCIKRKIRNFIELTKDGINGYNILVKMDKSLNSKFSAIYDESGLQKGKKGANKDDVRKAREFACKNYFDVRTFGAVMSTGDDPCGIVRGPVQINFARSISPIFISEITLTRQAVTTDKDFGNKDNEMGRKSIIPYALFRAEGYVSANLANKTGFDENDLELLWQAIINMFEEDHSAARGKMCMRKLYVFKHDGVLGNAPSHKLFDLIKISQKDEKPPREFGDYKILVEKDKLPSGVNLEEKIDKTIW